MPRPSKHVPPETLGGRIRAARESQHLSLAEVAGERYSTSLISQIERNRVEPSQESLQYLSDKLKLPFWELELLAQTQRETDSEEQQYRQYDELRVQVEQARNNKEFSQALEFLGSLTFSQIPLSLRWRLASLRGQCYFDLRKFLPAQRDFLIAVAEKPEAVPAQQQFEEMILHLRLAATYRELEQLEEALAEYQAALKMMDFTTSLLYIAETHWGMSLVSSTLANKPTNGFTCPGKKVEYLHRALDHAKNASVLYRSVGDTLREALLLCQIGLIQKAQGDLEGARHQLRDVLDAWQPELEQVVGHTGEHRKEAQRQRKERANLVSAVACSLASIELEARKLDEAEMYARLAIEIGQQSYKIRQAEASMMLGRILEARDKQNPEAQEAFESAIQVLSSTDRLAARIRAHDFLGRHLLKKGETEAGEKELDHARYLANLASGVQSTLTPEGEAAE